MLDSMQYFESAAQQRSENTMKYDKLVRDRIPELIREAGSDCRIASVEDSELTYYLSKKMQEEVAEFIEDPCVEEAADIFEVFRGLLKIGNIDFSDVVFKAEDKRTARGGFELGIVLKEVTKN